MNPEVDETTFWDLLTLRTAVKYQYDSFFKKPEVVHRLIVNMSRIAVILGGSAALKCREIITTLYAKLSESDKDDDSNKLCMGRILTMVNHAVTRHCPQDHQFFRFLNEIWKE